MKANFTKVSYKKLFKSNVVFQGGGSGDQQKAAQERQAQVEDMKNNILIQVLSQEARARRKFMNFIAYIHLNCIKNQF